MRLLTLALAALLRAGCGGGGRAAGGDEPVTARALAAVAAEHVGEPSSGRSGFRYPDREPFVEQADLRYGSGGESDGGLLRVTVVAGRELPTCPSSADAGFDGCAETDEGLLLWDLEVPEEDPGQVVVLVAKREAHARVLGGSDTITGDPREQDLEVPVETLFALAADPRVDVTTSREAVEAGEDLAWFEGD